MKMPHRFWVRIVISLGATALAVSICQSTAATISLGSAANSIAWDYSSGAQFHTGTYAGSIPVGNINTVPTQVRSFIKFDISSFTGRSLQEATLTLPRDTGYAVTGTHNIAVQLVDFDAGAAAFTNSPVLLNRTLSSPTVFDVTNATTTYSVNITAAVQSALSRGYTYVTIRLNDSTADAGSVAPSYVFFSATPTLTLTEAAPAPLGTVTTQMAWDYLSGGQFHSGDYLGALPLGNINTVPTRVRTFIKFNLAQYAGHTVAGATLTLPRATAYTVTGTHTIGVDLVDYDAGASAFGNSPALINRSVTTGTTFNVTNATVSSSVNITQIIQTALSRGYQYVTIRLRDNTAEAGSTAPSYVFFTNAPSLSIAEPPITLVNAGVSRVSIHNLSSSTPSLVEQYAAQQLQAAIACLTGVTPAINPVTPAAVQIKLGLVPQFSNGIGTTDDQAYAYRHGAGGHLEIVANTGGGLLWGVDGFSRDVLKVMWPVADGQITRVGPMKSTLTISPADTLDAADFIRRGWIIADNADGYHYNDLICDWMARTRQNVILNPVFQLTSAQSKKLTRGIEPDASAHSFWWLVPADTYYDTHPEYFPLVNGLRLRPTSPDSLFVQLCLSNPAVLQIAVQKALQSFALYPEMKVFGVTQNDGNGGWCQCANCQAWDGSQANTGVYSNRLIHFVNLVAQGIATSYPDKMIGTLAYGETVVPPTITVDNNVAITFATGGRNYMRKLTDTSDASNATVMSSLNGWLGKAAHVRLWEYYYHTGIERCAMPWTRTLCNEYLELFNLGVEGIYGQTAPKNWVGMSLFGYAFSRLSWNSALTYNQIMADFCAERYGPAAATMESFHRLYEDTIYTNVPTMTMQAPGEQLLPTAFTSTQLTTLDNYLTTATTTVTASGTAYHQGQVAKERTLFNSFKQLLVDPATLPGIGPNLITNPGGESTTGWGTNIQSGSYTFDTPTATPHSGTKSFRIHSTGTGGWARWYTTLSGLIPGKKYAIRLWIKANAGSFGEIWMICGDQQISMAYMDSQNQWARLIYPEFTATATTGSFYMNSFSPGDASFDDLLIVKLPD